MEDEAPPPPDPATAGATRCCWRCRKFYSTALVQACPHCGAPAELSVPLAASTGPGVEGQAVSKLMVACGLLLATSIGFALAGRSVDEEEVAADPEVAASLLRGLTIFEVIDTAIVAIALLKLHKVIPFRPAGGSAARGWTMLGPLLVVGLGANFLYHWGVRELTGVEPVAEGVYAHPGLLPWVVLVYCVQPAIVEELFFRYLCLGAMRPLMGTGAAIFVSSILFGMAHLGALLSLPALIFIGIVLGYARVASGTLLVPILIHFLHNLTIVLVGMYDAL